MLKLIFWTLLGLNAVLFAYDHGALGSFKAGEREPGRIKNQINTDKLRLQPAGLPPVLPTSPEAAAPAVTETSATGALIACTEIGNFAAAEARRFERQVAPLQLADKQSQEEVAGQEITSHMVMIPPLGSKEAADKKAAELKAQGVSNFFIMNDSSPTKWAISLGVFKSEAAAQTLMAALKKQGVVGAKVAGRSSAATRLVYRFRNIDADTRAKLDAIAAKFTADTRTCK
ncbi:SPOR domain-containing protein [Massilia sp. TWP1-3-3]|uniref:SPOR domain-containing protein n=1 Tax=Massilia sp. TWP1-3-3 TaxID=2804573 RepID=UPI003CEEC66C